MKCKKNIFLILLCLYYLLSSTSFAENKVVIIIASDNVEKISLETVSNLYSFRQRFISNSQRIKLTYLPLSSEDTVMFTQKVFNYYPYQLKRIWDRLIFSGKASPPKLFEEEKTLLEFIKSNNNIIGYLYIEESELSARKGKYNVITTIH